MTCCGGLKRFPVSNPRDVITFLPLSFNGMNFSFSLEGRAAPSDMSLPFALYRVVSPDYFRAMGIPLHARTLFRNA